MSEEIEKIKGERKKWEEKVIKPSLDRFGLKESPNRFYCPADLENFDFLTDVGFPGQYPFTAGTYAVIPYRPALRGSMPGGSGLVRAATYSGYGTAEDTRDYYMQMQKLGQRGGPNLAFDLPSQCGYDSSNPMVRGEVGKTGVAVDTLRDFEIIYEPFQGDLNLDRIASNYTINAPANIILAMYFALAEKRGISFDKLRATPQNDILKEFVARGTYIFPPGPSMRMVRDSIVFITKYCPSMNINQLGGYHIRQAGATRAQDLAFSMANLIAYIKEGIRAGLDVDEFVPRFTVNSFGGSMEFFKEIAFQRAARRMWAKILKERFGAKKERTLLLRAGLHANMGNENCTVQRPLNNITRAVVGAIASALSGGMPIVYPPYDEALGLGWSMEASQLAQDGARILQYEAKLTEVLDPLAGSYHIESLTNEIESAARDELNKIEAMGGAVVAIENGYMQREIAKGAYERQKRIENGEDLIVGVNCFVGEDELEVMTTRLVPHPYDPEKREKAEEKQIQNLMVVNSIRDNHAVSKLLNDLKVKAKDENENLIPTFIECAKAYVTLQEMCDVLRDIFGEYQPIAL
jgi:methylmalonyl-CoA mutase N-terminal domain/subunit